jgi:SAM-dependent methyltransferase
MPLFTRTSVPPTWPKKTADLSAEQRRIREDWLGHMLVQMPGKYGNIARFNNQYAVRSARPGRTLEIGAGLGEHLPYEDLAAQEYHTVELSETMAEGIRRDCPSAVTVTADCQRRLPYDDASFDRALAIHVLEHLPNLPGALDEIRRVLKPGGAFAVVIPCEGGLGYTLARRLTTQREFERRYNTSYGWHVASEHVNRAHEVLSELRSRFDLTDPSYYPSRLPLIDLNLLIGVTCIRRTGG